MKEIPWCFSDFFCFFQTGDILQRNRCRGHSSPSHVSVPGTLGAVTGDNETLGVVILHWGPLRRTAEPSPFHSVLFRPRFGGVE